MNNDELLLRIYECNKCSSLNIERNPSKGIIPLFGEGDPNNPLWIVGLNPKLEEEGMIVPDNEKSFTKYLKVERAYFNNMKTSHSYFKDFKHIFGPKWESIFKKHIFYTDLVKYGSPNFKEIKKPAIKNCEIFLLEQIKAFTPRIIFCNGTPVVDWFKEHFTIKDNENNTQGELFLKDNKLSLIYSGFIGRIDNYARRRIKPELINLLKSINSEESNPQLQDTESRIK
ncbi:MAG: uracil-DNA glycosylase family protein [Candidatus Hermodarchaeota archaeon]